MPIVLQAILPIFALILLGYVMGWRQWLTAPASAGLAQLTFKLFMPAVLFNGLARADLAQGLSLWLILGYFIPALLVFWLVNVCDLRLQGRPSPLGLSAAYSNNLLVSIPVVTVLMGEQALVYVFAVLAFHNLILLLAHSLFGTFKAGTEVDYKALLKSLQNPLLTGLLLGALVNLSGWELPEAFWRFSGWLAQAALPCALLVLGLSLARYRISPDRRLLLSCTGKLILLPLLVWVVSGLFGSLSDEARHVLVLMAAAPTGINALALVETPEDERAISSTVFLSTVLSSLSLPVWILLTG